MALQDLPDYEARASDGFLPRRVSSNSGHHGSSTGIDGFTIDCEKKR
jgi:hypothetical protein